jgi:hypothetical protein
MFGRWDEKVQMIVVIFVLNYAVFAGDLRFWIYFSYSSFLVRVYEKQINNIDFSALEMPG